MTEKSRKILLFSTNYLPYIGGAELALFEITSRIKDVDFYLITSRLQKSDVQEEKIGNVIVNRVSSKILLPVFGFLKARRLKKTIGDFDYVFSLQASQGGGSVASILSADSI